MLPVPLVWCRLGVTFPELVTNLNIEVNYVDFRDTTGEFIKVCTGICAAPTIS